MYKQRVKNLVHDQSLNLDKQNIANKSYASFYDTV